MEDLKREFDQGRGNMTRDPDVKAPQPPEKILPSTEAGTIQTEDMRQHYRQGSKGIDGRHASDGADSALQGRNKLPRDRERSSNERLSREKPSRHGDGESGRHAPYVATIGSLYQHSHSMSQPHGGHYAPAGGGAGPAQSRDDLDLPDAPDALSQSQEERLWREIDGLRRELELEKRHGEEQLARADQAERAAEKLQETLRDQQARIDGNFAEVVEGGEALADIVVNLTKENESLKAELEDARSHIFSLQPYRKDLTPEEAGRDYDDVVQMISDWVLKIAEPVVDNPNRRESFISAAKKQPNDIAKLKKFMMNHGELVHGSLFPDTDIDVLTAIVLRFVHDNIFQKVLFGDLRNPGEVITSIEASMQTNVEPKRDQFAIRTWRAEAFTAILSSPEYQSHRMSRVKDLTVDLCSGLKLFRRDQDHRSFCISCQDNVVLPALKLHEKLLMSTHHFYLDINPYIVWNNRQVLEMSPDFLDNLGNLKCENILQNRRPLNFSKLDPPPTREDLVANLVNVMTVAPGLYMRQIGRGDAIKPPMVVRRQHLLVAYGPQDKRDRFTANSDRTLMNWVYFAKSEKHERSSEGPWAAWKNIAWG